MKIRFIFHTIAFSLLLSLGACAQVTPPPTLPDITFAHLSPIELNVGSVEVESKFTSPLTPPHAEHKVPQSPEQVLRHWADDRLKSTGGDLFARFIIVDATVTEHVLETDETISAVFTHEQELRYEAAAEAILEIRNAQGSYLGNATARATRAITVPENATINEREQVLFDLIDQLMNSFNTELESKIRTHLSQWVR